MDHYSLVSLSVVDISVQNCLCDSSLSKVNHSALAAITRIVGAVCASERALHCGALASVLEHCVKPSHRTDASVACACLYTLKRVSCINEKGIVYISQPLSVASNLIDLMFTIVFFVMV